jgi:anti-sigma B factor antagonist
MLKVNAQEFGSVIILCLQGQIMIGETEVLRGAVHSHNDTKAIVLDLNQVSGIDAAGLGILLELRQWAVAVGTKFSLRNVPERVKQVLKITRLDSVFENSSEAELLFFALSAQPRVKPEIPHCGQVVRNEHALIARHGVHQQPAVRC